jgi:hypothetical protein
VNHLTNEPVTTMRSRGTREATWLLATAVFAAAVTFAIFGGTWPREDIYVWYAPYSVLILHGWKVFGVLMVLFTLPRWGFVAVRLNLAARRALAARRRGA